MITTKRIPWIASAICLALLSATFVAAQRSLSPEALYQRALQKEKVDGDTKAAVDLYNQVLAAPGASEKLKSQAQVRVSALAGPSTGSLSQRLVCTWSDECNLDIASISADGRQMAFFDARNGDLAVRDMATGKSTVVAKATDKEHARPEGFLLSPDGKQTVYSWFVTDGNPQLRVISNEAGSKARILVSDPESYIFIPSAWATDGKSILVSVAKRDSTWQFVWVSMSSGKVTPIKSLGWRVVVFGGLPEGVSLSPDGRYIAYSALASNPSMPNGRGQNQAEKDRNIYLIAADGTGPEIVLVKGGNNQFPVWMPDGKNLLFVSDRSGSSGIWSASVLNGQAAGEPLQLKREVGEIRPIGSTRSGSYYYVNYPTQLPKVSVLKAASNHVQPGSLPKETIIGADPVWSPEGKRIAIRNSIGGVSVYSGDTSTEKRFSPPNGLKFAEDGAGLLWFHDGKSILLPLQGQTGSSLYRLDVNSGEFKRVAARFSSGEMVLSLDDKTLYGIVQGELSTTSTSRMDRIVSIDLNSGERNTVATVSSADPSPLILSPDGQSLYLKSSCDQRARRVCQSITSVELSSGKQKQSLTVQDTESILGDFALSWNGRTIAASISHTTRGTPNRTAKTEIIGVDGTDRNSIHSAMTAPSSLAWVRDDSSVMAVMDGQLMRIPAAGGNPELVVSIEDKQRRGVRPIQPAAWGGGRGVGVRRAFSSPDGSSIVLASNVINAGELWAIDNVSSFLKTAR